MTLWTVEVTVRPVENDDWTVLESVLDTVPGTLLVRDPAAPVLLFPVEDASPMRAGLFVDGVAQLKGFEIVSGEIYENEDADEHREDVNEAPTAVVQAIETWVESVPPMRGHLADDGNLEYV